MRANLAAWVSGWSTGSTVATAKGGGTCSCRYGPGMDSLADPIAKRLHAALDQQHRAGIIACRVNGGHLPIPE